MIILLLELVLQLNSCFALEQEQMNYCIWDTTMQFNAVLNEIEERYVKFDY